MTKPKTCLKFYEKRKKIYEDAIAFRQTYGKLPVGNKPFLKERYYIRTFLENGTGVWKRITAHEEGVVLMDKFIKLFEEKRSNFTTPRMFAVFTEFLEYVQTHETMPPAKTKLYDRMIRFRRSYLRYRAGKRTSECWKNFENQEKRIVQFFETILPVMTMRIQCSISHIAQRKLDFIRILKTHLSRTLVVHEKIGDMSFYPKYCKERRALRQFQQRTHSKANTWGRLAEISEYRYIVDEFDEIVQTLKSKCKR